MNLKVLFLLLLFLPGCASVKIYTNEEDKKNSKAVGLKFYQSKPFLLVEHNPSKDVKVKTSIVYLPDLANPRYIRTKTGWGSANATMAFANGVLTSYGAVTDSKVPETITAFSGLLTAAAGVPGALSPTVADDAAEQGGGDEDIQKVWKEQAEKLIDIIGEEEKEKGVVKPGKELRNLSKLATGPSNPGKVDLKKLIAQLKDPILKDITLKKYARKKEIADQLTKVANNIAKLNLPDAARRPSDQMTKDQLVKDLLSIAKAINPPKPQKVSYVELFEILYQGNAYTFKKIDFPTAEAKKP